QRDQALQRGGATGPRMTGLGGFLERIQSRQIARGRQGLKRFGPQGVPVRRPRQPRLNQSDGVLVPLVRIGTERAANHLIARIAVAQHTFNRFGRLRVILEMAHLMETSEADPRISVLHALEQSVPTRVAAKFAEYSSQFNAESVVLLVPKCLGE